MIDTAHRVMLFRQKTLPQQRKIIDTIISWLSTNTIDVVRDILSLRKSIDKPSSDFCVARIELLYTIINTLESHHDNAIAWSYHKIQTMLDTIHSQEAEAQENVEHLLDTITTND